MTILIKNARAVMGDEICGNTNILIKDGKIAEISAENHNADITLDAMGDYVSAGFIDLHVHGGNGSDFMDGTKEAFRTVAHFHAMHGTTSMCPTNLSGNIDEIINSIDTYNTVKKEGTTGSDFVGIHLEGPCFDLEMAGAQDPKYIHAPIKSEYERILKYSESIARWSYAPELDENYEFTKRLVQCGILPSAGHTAVDCRGMLEAVQNGCTHITHFYSCIKGIERKLGERIAGCVEAGYLSDDITLEIIADGKHLPKELLQLVYKIKGASKTALITDAMRGAGFPDGTVTKLGSLEKGTEVIIEDGVAKLKSRTAYAGSVAAFDRLIRTMLSAGIPLTEAVKMGTETPAKILNLKNVGKLKQGYKADIVIFDENINIKNVIVNGNIIK